MQGPISGKPQLNRKINASLVLGLIQSDGPISRADLVKRTGLRAPSISAIVQHLIDRHLVFEESLGKSTGGRQPMLLQINPSGLFAAGAEIGEDALNGVIVNLAGRVVAVDRVELRDTRPETVASAAKGLLKKMCASARLGTAKLSGLGVAVPGIISKDDGVVLFSRPLNWQRVALGALLSKATNLDVLVLNNATAGALAESSVKGASRRSLLYVLVNLRHVRQQMITSLGCGIVLDGRAYVGEGHMAGEIRVDIEHPLASATRLMGAKAPHGFEALLSASRKEPAAFRKTWTAFAEGVGRVISSGTDFLNPSQIVIGTDTPELDALAGAGILEFVRSHTVSGLVAEMHGIPEVTLPRLRFATLETGTLARGAIVPQLQELSLLPLLHDSVLA